MYETNEGMTTRQKLDDPFTELVWVECSNGESYAYFVGRTSPNSLRFPREMKDLR